MQTNTACLVNFLENSRLVLKFEMNLKKKAEERERIRKYYGLQKPRPSLKYIWQYGYVQITIALNSEFMINIFICVSEQEKQF